MLRLLGELGFVARLKVGRTAKSTCDTYWLVVSGADQVERLSTSSRRPIASRSLARSPAAEAHRGHRVPQGLATATAWVRVVEKRAVHARGHVYSLEVPGRRDLRHHRRPGRPQLLPQGCLRPQAARRQLRLPLPAPDRRDRGQRAAEAARGQQAEEAPRLAGRQADRAARPRLQAAHRRHARGLERGARRAAAGRGRDRARLRPRRRGAGARDADRRRDVRLGAGGASRAPTRP